MSPSQFVSAAAAAGYPDAHIDEALHPFRATSVELSANNLNAIAFFTNISDCRAFGKAMEGYNKKYQ